MTRSCVTFALRENGSELPQVIQSINPTEIINRIKSQKKYRKFTWRGHFFFFFFVKGEQSVVSTRSRGPRSDNYCRRKYKTKSNIYKYKNTYNSAQLRKKKKKQRKTDKTDKKICRLRKMFLHILLCTSMNDCRLDTFSSADCKTLIYIVESPTSRVV